MLSSLILLYVGGLIALAAFHRDLLSDPAEQLALILWPWKAVVALKGDYDAGLRR